MDIIHTYTRKEALEDGLQIEVDPGLAAEAGFKVPIYMTSGIRNLITQAVFSENHCNDFNGVAWDILTVLMSTIKAARDSSIVKFTVKISGVGRKRNHEFLAEIGPVDMDNQAPALTIMLPEER
jgi:hypothetical protein